MTPRRRNPARLVVALSVAAVLAVFLLYTSLAAGTTPTLQPSELESRGDSGEVSLDGVVTGPVSGDARGDGLRFGLRDHDGTGSVPVVYKGSVPDLFRPGRTVFMRGELERGLFVAEPNTLVTKCPSKYSDKPS